MQHEKTIKLRLTELLFPYDTVELQTLDDHNEEDSHYISAAIKVNCFLLSSGHI